MDEHKSNLTVTRLCSLFGATRQAYYKYDEQALQTTLLRDKMAIDYALHIREQDPGIGGKKLYAMYLKELQSENPIGRDRFLRLLSQRGLSLRKRQSRVPRTTDSRHNLPTYPNKIWSVIPQCANQIWVSDITYIKIVDSKHLGLYSFCYLSLITDVYSKMIVGYAVGDSLDTIHPLSALQMALKTLPEDFDGSCLVHHSDRGVQYASMQYVKVLNAHNINISMTENGNPKHNAVAERINNTIKNEFFAKLQFTSIKQVKTKVKEAVEFYNMQRPHMSINGMTPAEAAQLNGEIKKNWYSYREKAIKDMAG